MYSLYLQKLKLCDKMVKKCKLCTKVGEIMKLKQKIFCIATVIVLLFSLSACGKTKTKWSVEGVYSDALSLNASSVYRYKVKQIELIADADVDENNLKADKVLKVSTDFAYYYSNAELSQYFFSYKDTRNFYSGDVIPETELSQVFDKITYKSLSGYGSYYQAYSSADNAFVKVRIIIEGLDVVYRPTVSEKNDVATVTYNALNATCALKLGSCALYKNEVSGVDYKADRTDYLKSVADNVGSESAVKKLEESFDKKYKHSAILEEYKVTFNTAATAVVILYNGEKK